MQKTSVSIFLGYLGERIFHIFPRLHSIMGSAPIPFLWIVTICNLNPNVGAFCDKKFIFKCDRAPRSDSETNR